MCVYIDVYIYSKASQSSGKKGALEICRFEIIDNFLLGSERREGGETHFKQFTIGGFALKRQLPRRAEDPGLSQCLSSPSRCISWSVRRRDATIAHSRIGNNWEILKFLTFLSLCLPQPHTSTQPPIPSVQAESQAGESEQRR